MIDWYSCWFWLSFFSGFWVIYFYDWWLIVVQFVLVSFPQVQHLLQYQRQKGSGPTGPMGWHGLFFLPHNRLADLVMDRREISWHNWWKPDPRPMLRWRRVRIQQPSSSWWSLAPQVGKVLGDPGVPEGPRVPRCAWGGDFWTVLNGWVQVEIYRKLWICQSKMRSFLYIFPVFPRTEPGMFSKY